MTDKQGNEINGREVVITALAHQIPLASNKTMNHLQFDKWERTEPGNQTHLVLTEAGIFEGKWLNVRDSWYLNKRAILLEMIPASITSSCLRHSAYIDQASRPTRLRIERGTRNKLRVSPKFQDRERVAAELRE